MPWALNTELSKTVQQSGIFRALQKERKRLAQDKQYILETMRKGARKAREAASVYLERARHNVGLDYWNF